MKNRTTKIIAAMALSGSAWAVSPYDTPYGVQMNFMIGVTGSDIGGGSRLDVTSDGTVFVNNRTGASTWGSGTGGNVRGGVGAITPLGDLVYGTTISSLPTMNAAGQQYAAGVSAAGNKAYFTVYGAQNQYWTGEDGKDANRAMVWSLDSSGLGSIADQHSLSIYSDNAGTLRTDPLVPTSTGLTPVAGQNRIAASDLRDSTLDMVMVNDMFGGDFGTLGDYGGTDLNKNASGVLSSAYQPGIAVYNFTTNTLTGPAKQPTVSYGGAATSWSNHSTYVSAAIDQSTGYYYGAGLSHARTSSTSDQWDPDGSGPAATIPLVNSTSSANSAGIGTAYDASHNLLYSVTWDTTGFDYITAIATTDDGSNGAFWAGEKLDDCYIELRDATGAILWSDSFDMSPSVGVERVISVRVQSNGDLFVSGYFENGGAGGGTAAYDNFVRRYKKTAPNTYTVQWTSTIGLTGARDLAYDTALDTSDRTVYLLADTFGQWPNPRGYVYKTDNNDLLVQKLTAGDFNTDGLVDFTDVQLAGTATKPGLPGNDTYDFNGDGDSTLADTTFMITSIMDRLVGDIAQDGLVTDVDNADIGRAIGALGAGTTYLDGDIDFDGDVDVTDLTAVSAAFTPAKTPSGYGSSLTAGATLRYRDTDGQVWIHADEATGGMITSFQLENAAGTFVPANYTDLAGGTFGAGYKDVSANVLGDTDTDLTGASGTSGLISLGKVFPAGMDLAGLQAYLTTAVYTGQSGSGQKRFNLVVGNLLTPYETWASGFAGLTDINSNIDFEGDGLSTGIEYVLGGDPTVNDAASIAPTSAYNGSGLVFTFRRTDLANTDPNTTISVAYSTDLQSWTTAQDTVNGVAIVATNDFYGTGIDQVVVTLPTGLAAGGKLFARLGVSGLPVSLLSENFETSNGGFTTVGSPNDWDWGTPNSNDGFGFTVTAGNGGSAKCWGTGLGNGTIPSGLVTVAANSILQSPSMNFTGLATVELTFAASVSAPVADTIQVLIREQGTDALLGTLTPITPSSNAPWATFGPLDISVAAGKTAYLQFRYVGTDGTYCGLYIDDVKVNAKP